MKKVLSIVLTMSMSLALTPSVLADEIFNSENAVQPSQVVYDVLNDEGTHENQEILSLDINGTLPEYITDVTYLDMGNHLRVSEKPSAFLQTASESYE